MKKGLASRRNERGFFCANMKTSRPELFSAFDGNCPRGEDMPGRPTGLLYLGGNMEINLTEKRLRARQRKVEADELRRVMKIVQECFDLPVKEGFTFPAWILMGCILGCSLLIIFAAANQ